ncbi:hypothetical protein EST38_g4150 [Candolleomyces aberdarensis]|uniref:BRCT domain-containing protein n=1 Tax=Candolleomyces aberdarensis TaxID=2316362 RepID=A0A4Q2DNN2_9AGAR|nr:hypothetical protein EST38_g4150 [Candolleomyces aberdarensis]
MQLFSSIRYYLSPTLTPEKREFLQYTLDNNGARAAESLSEATHVISNSDRFEGWQDLREETAVVTDKWLERSLVLGKPQPPNYYSVDPAMIFSGVIACATELPAQDLEVLSAGILALGGQWRTGLTKEVTHLFAIDSKSSKYSTALHHQDQTHVKVVLPHWFDDSVRLGLGGLATEPYEWPDPPILRNDQGLFVGKKEEGEEDVKVKRATNVETDPLKRSYYSTAIRYIPDPSSSSPVKIPTSSLATSSNIKPVWEGRRILLGRSLMLFKGRRQAVEVGIQRAGGEIVRWDGDEEEDLEEQSASSEDTQEAWKRRERERERKEANAVEGCDIYITRWRVGRAYVRAYRCRKTIGTLAWLYHVQSTGTVTSPLDQLLHYPIPNKKIEGFTQHEITVTNYTGEAREYLKKLITTMGAQFTPSMSGKNTALVAATKDGTKATKAQSWSIPVVNHTWLEDCFVQWRNLTLATDKYIKFPPGIDFAKMLGERGVGVGVSGRYYSSGEGKEDKGGGKLDEEVSELEGVYEGEDEDDQTDASRLNVKSEQGDEEEELSEGEREDVGMQMEVDFEVPVHPDSDNDGGNNGERHARSRLQRKNTANTDTQNSVRDANEVSDVLLDGDGDAVMSNPAATPPEEEAEPPLPPPRKKRGSTTVQAKAGGTAKSVSTPKRKGKSVNGEGSQTEDEVVSKPPQSKAKAKAKKVVQEEEEEEESEEDDEGGYASSPLKSKSGKTPLKSNAKPTSSRKSPTKSTRSKQQQQPSDSEDDEIRVVQHVTRRVRVVVDEDEDHGDEEENEQAKKGRRKSLSDRKTGGRESSAKTRMKGRSSTGKSVVEVEEEEEPVSKSKSKASPGKSKAKAKSKTVQRSEDEDEGEPPVTTKKTSAHSISTTTARPKSKSAASSKAPPPPPSEDSEDSDEPPESIFAPTTKKGSGKENEKAIEKEKEKEKENSIVVKPKSKAAATSKSDGKAPSKPGKGKAKQAPEVESEDEDEDVNMEPPPEEDEEEVPAKKGKKKQPPTKPAASTSTARKRRSLPEDPPPPPAVPSGSKSQKPKSTSGSTAAAARPSMGPPPVPAARASVAPSDVTSTSTTSHTPGTSKRAAAAKATAKLHDVIMPDVINFESQMRKARKSGGGASGFFVVSGDTPEEEDGAGRRGKKGAAGKGKEKEADGDDGDEKKVAGKRRKRNSDVAAEQEGGDEEEEEEEENQQKKKRKKGEQENISVGAAKKGGQASIKLTTTQVQLDDDVIKALNKLGVTMCTRPSECTHLLASAIVRTEKFLVALAGGAYILSKDWALDSAKAGKLLPESKYTLNDPSNKYDLDLEASLNRARKGKLFEGKTFYVAGKSILSSLPLLKNVVMACGGQLKEVQKLTQRVLSAGPERYAISSQADVSAWRQLAEQGFMVYSLELVLSGALHQRLNLDEYKLSLEEDQ